MYKITLAALSAAVLMMACNHGKEHAASPEYEFPITSPLLHDTTLVQEYVCQIKSIQHVDLRALDGGYLQDIFVDEGALVHKGQLLFRILPVVYQAEWERSKAEAKYAEIELQNTKSLAEKNVVSKNELSLAKAKYDKALAEVSLAKAHLSFTEIRAPFDGIMDRLQARKGSLLEEGDLLTTVSDNSKMWVYFNVPEAEYLTYKTHKSSQDLNKVGLKMANQQLFEFSGKVETIEADFNSETGNIAFRATFPNPNGLLRHGETGNILMSIPLQKALIIPQKATFEVLEKKYVFVVNKQQEVEQREIQIAYELPDVYILKSGLKEGEQFIVEGLGKVHHQDHVKCVYHRPEDVLKSLAVYAE